MMNRFNKIVMLVFILVVSGYAQPVNEIMEEGNNYYKNEQWENAISDYSKILNLGYESAALYYNMGNAFYKTGNLGEAILSYERGLKLDPGNDDIQFNLKLVNARTIDNIKEVPKLFILEWWDLIVSALSVSGWATVVLLFYIALLLFIAVYFMSGNINFQRFSIYAGVVSLFLLFIVLIVFVASYEREVSSDYGIVLANTVNVKVSPTEESNDSFVIHEGLKFEIQDQLDDWVKIKLADGKIGWMPKNTLEKI